MAVEQEGSRPDRARDIRGLHRELAPRRAPLQAPPARLTAGRAPAHGLVRPPEPSKGRGRGEPLEHRRQVGPDAEILLDPRRVFLEVGEGEARGDRRILAPPVMDLFREPVGDRAIHHGAAADAAAFENGDDGAPAGDLRAKVAEQRRQGPVEVCGEVVLPVEAAFLEDDRAPPVLSEGDGDGRARRAGADDDVVGLEGRWRTDRGPRASAAAGSPRGGALRRRRPVAVAEDGRAGRGVAKRRDERVASDREAEESYRIPGVSQHARHERALLIARERGKRPERAPQGEGDRAHRERREGVAEGDRPRRVAPQILEVALDPGGPGRGRHAAAVDGPAEPSEDGAGARTHADGPGYPTM